ncbi:hypothetical protein BO70DRAFT_427138 [Aspergillus heteromorphus CBS 117.55]|uniref:CN hydrolase domain-containing protein n=1 Tax=Aspergillus heteromorphus CBS 117.55 TaxID=1448321 RepID=A0A317WPG7_9EURO|nr:uncharacterized protein BO70DRAFT_427138 [Aspergillus heteromorphus CBS 117.55]PWY88346.1 hypothetical protein BO70DRAFT_427138 [Aspergillus heteromorphus CBS 117.55]
MPPKRTLTLAIAQAHPPSPSSVTEPETDTETVTNADADAEAETKATSLTTLTQTTHLAASRGAHLLVFPAGYLACNRNAYLQAYNCACDLGDIPAPAGGGKAWVERERGMVMGMGIKRPQSYAVAVPGMRERGGSIGSSVSSTAAATGVGIPSTTGAGGAIGTGGAGTGTGTGTGTGEKTNIPGDGTREILEALSHATNVFLIVGVVERAGRALFSSVVFVHPAFGVVGKRRGVGLTPQERTLYTSGSASDLVAIKTIINGTEVTLGATIGAENYMPLVRHSLYAQGVEVFCALGSNPDGEADGDGDGDGDGVQGVWGAVVRTVAVEGRVVVLGASDVVSSAGSTSKSTSLEGRGRDRGREDQTGGYTGRDVSGSVGSDGTGDRTVGFATGYSSFGDIAPGVDPLCLPPNPRLRKRSVTLEGPHEIVWPDGRFGGAAAGTTVDTGPGTAPEAEAQQRESQVSERDVSPTTTKKTKRKMESLSGESYIVGPLGEVLAGPVCFSDGDGGLLVREIDLEDCIRARMDLGCCPGEAFRLVVDGVDLGV